MAESWGMLGADVLTEERRVRSLGLAPVVRWYNDAAVPGLGGVWFGKPLVLALAGIEIAHQQSLRPVVVANAVEALSCWQAIHKLKRTRDPRLRGTQKLASKPCPSFAQARRPNFYVTQPMRQQTVQPLRALGLVETALSDRFNAYRVSDAGRRLLHATFLGMNPYNSTVLGVLGQWVAGRRDAMDSEILARALSPTDPLPADARAILREQFVGGDDRRDRRAAALAWVTSDVDKRGSDWNKRAPEIEPEHWEDLRAGAGLFAVRDAALLVLQEIEIKLTTSEDHRVSLHSLWKRLEKLMATLRRIAQSFLDQCHDTSAGAAATRFCRECVETAPAELLRALVARDDRVLRLKGEDVVKGSAFKPVSAHYGSRGASETDENDSMDLVEAERWPEGISRRIPSLHMLALDLDGGLESYLRAREVIA